MRYENNDAYEINKNSGNWPGSPLMGVNALIGNDVYNQIEEDLGDIKEIMLNMESGKIVYAVLSFGGVLGIGEKL
ncbi:MAG: PRC-barrel domain-containing protein, partial [Pseudomonadota bacterium]|nr:PRC-barrel domain-containing protein [Pseudomonadota bacterium]